VNNWLRSYPGAIEEREVAFASKSEDLIAVVDHQTEKPLLRHLLEKLMLSGRCACLRQESVRPPSCCRAFCDMLIFM